MKAKCHDCERAWERIYMEPVFDQDTDAIIWLCPECWDDMMANSE